MDTKLFKIGGDLRTMSNAEYQSRVDQRGYDERQLKERLEGKCGEIEDILRRNALKYYETYRSEPAIEFSGFCRELTKQIISLIGGEMILKCADCGELVEVPDNIAKVVKGTKLLCMDCAFKQKEKPNDRTD